MFFNRFETFPDKAQGGIYKVRAFPHKPQGGIHGKVPLGQEEVPLRWLRFGTHHRVRTVGALHVGFLDNPLDDTARLVADDQLATRLELVFKELGSVREDQLQAVEPVDEDVAPSVKLRPMLTIKLVILVQRGRRCALKHPVRAYASYFSMWSFWK